MERPYRSPGVAPTTSGTCLCIPRDPPSPVNATFVAGRRRRDMTEQTDPRLVRIDAHHAPTLNLLARGRPGMAGCEVSLATVLRGSARTAYWKRFLGAYGSYLPICEAPHRMSRTKFTPPPGDRRCYVQPPTTITSVATPPGLLRSLRRANICAARVHGEYALRYRPRKAGSRPESTTPEIGAFHTHSTRTPRTLRLSGASGGMP